MVKIPRALCGLAITAGFWMGGSLATFADDKPAGSETQSVEKFLPPSLQSKPVKGEGVATVGNYGKAPCTTCAPKCAPKYEDDVCDVCGQHGCHGHHDHDISGHLHDKAHQFGEAMHGKFNRERLRARFGYFIPEGSCGQGTPPLGHYNMAYAVNPYHFDPRDAGVYSATGYGIPIAVPLAPVVEHQYNYSWGIPSSRLTGLYRYNREPGIIAPVGYGPAIGPGAYPTHYPPQHPFVGNPGYAAPVPAGVPVEAAVIPEARADKKTQLR